MYYCFLAVSARLCLLGPVIRIMTLAVQIKTVVTDVVNGLGIKERCCKALA